MSLPALSHTNDPFPGSAADAAVLLVPDTTAFPDALDAYPGLADILAGIGFTGSAGAFARIHFPALTELPLAVVGIGATPSDAAVRDAAGVALRTLTGFESVAIGLAASLHEFAAAAAEGAVFGGYRFEGYRAKPGKARASSVTLHSSRVTDEDIAHARIVGDALALVKDLVSVPAEWQSPRDLAQSAVDAVTDLDISVEVLDETALEEQGYGGILGVGRGSDRPPRLVRLDYTPADACATSHSLARASHSTLAAFH